MHTVVSVKVPTAAPIDLGKAPTFDFGDVSVDPAAREIRGPARAVMLEPRVMQLLVALAEAQGAVVSRDRLVERCWGDVVVGDDSLNRAIAGLRRGLVDCGSRTVEVGTVPKVGYRLLVAQSAPRVDGAADEAAPTVGGRTDADPSRRRMITAGATILAGGLVGIGGWMTLRTARGSRIAADIARAEELLQQDRYGAEGEARALLEPTVVANPTDARGWGLLAVAWQQIASATVAATLPEAEARVRESAARALALDRLQGDAQAALALVNPSFGAWMAADERLRRVLEVVPGNIFAQQGMVNLLMAGGRLQEARRLVATAGAAHPGSVAIRSAALQLIWAEAGPGTALQLADTLGAGSIRVAVVPWLLALAGRHAEAEAMIAAIQARQRVPSRVLAAQRLTARALGAGKSQDRNAARDALLPLGTLGGLANYMAIGGLAGLGFVDEAYALAERWYSAALEGGDTQDGRARRHRTSTRILFLPITQAMRADARFVPLCERIGLVGYWRQRGMRADTLKDRLLPL